MHKCVCVHILATLFLLNRVEFPSILMFLTLLVLVLRSHFSDCQLSCKVVLLYDYFNSVIELDFALATKLRKFLFSNFI